MKEANTATKATMVTGLASAKFEIPYLNTASISCLSLAIASPWVANHFSLSFGLPELLVHEYVIPCPLLSDITMISIPRCVALVVVTLIMFLILWGSPCGDLYTGQRLSTGRNNAAESAGSEGKTIPPNLA
jgi:hypothetical protein